MDKNWPASRRANGQKSFIARGGFEAIDVFFQIGREALLRIINGGKERTVSAEGKPLFAALRRRALMTRRPRPDLPQHAAAIFAFDILRLAGEDLRDRPLIERKRLLKRVLKKGRRPHYLQHIEEQGGALFAAMVAHQLEHRREEGRCSLSCQPDADVANHLRAFESALVSALVSV